MLQTDPMSTVGLEYFRENGSDACGLSLARGCCWNDDVIEGIETTALIQALLRMTQLLRVALGPTGANFVKAIVADDDDADEDGGSGAGAAVPGDANRLGLKGVARSGIFIFCDVRLSALRCTSNLTLRSLRPLADAQIRNFTDTTEILQGQVFTWINNIASIVHGICGSYSGNAVKHVGDAFMMVWMLDYDENFEEEEEEAGGEGGLGRRRLGQSYQPSSRRMGTVAPTSEQARVAKLHQNYRAQSERTLVAVTKVIISLYLNDMFSQCSDEIVNRLDRAGLQKVRAVRARHQ